MPFDLQAADGLVRVTFHGQVTGEDLTRLAEMGRGLEAALEVSPHRVADLSRVEGVQLDFVTMEAFAAIRRAAPIKNKVKSAIVAPRPLQFGFARMFQALNNHPRIEIRVFKDLESALQWIAETHIACDAQII